MLNLEIIKPNCILDNSREELAIANKLPPEMIEIILNNLNPPDRTSLSRLNKYWRAVVLNYEIRKYRIPIQQNREFLVENLFRICFQYRFHYQVEEINYRKIIQKIDKINTEVTFSTFEIRERLVNILKRFPIFILKKLDDSYKFKKYNPSDFLFISFSDLALKIIYKNQALTINSKMMEESKKDMELYRIYQLLMEKNDIDGAADVAKMMSLYRQETIIPYLADLFIQKGLLIKALKLIEQMPLNDCRYSMTESIAMLFANKREIQFAIELSIKNSLINAGGMAEALKWICKILSEEGKFDEAIDLAKKISHEWSRADALKIISETAAKNLYIDKAKEILNLITQEAIKFYAKQEIEIIEKEISRSGILGYIKILLKNKRYDEALNHTIDIEDPYSKAEMMNKLSLIVAKNGDIKKAIEIAEMITDSDIQMASYANIAILIAKNRNIEESVEIAKMIIEPKIQSIVYGNIAVIVAEYGDIKKAYTIANYITLESIKTATHGNIYSIHLTFYGKNLSYNS